jgi:hypothetical protein
MMRRRGFTTSPAMKEFTFNILRAAFFGANLAGFTVVRKRRNKKRVDPTS